jgi:signal transduction histidine kinase
MMLTTDHSQTLEVPRADWAMLMHDLRNPLATVHGYTQLLLLNTAEQDSQTPGLGEGLRHIRDAALRLERLLDQLAAVPELARDRAKPPQRGRTDLVQVARQIAAQSQPAADSRDRVMVVPACAELWGEWDLTALERVLGNLLDNALKYSAANRTVVVGIRSHGNRAVITVRDQGIGIPSAELPRVFELGFRASNAGPGRGRGIGMTAVRSIVHELDGTISVDSHEGLGTTVTVEIPASQGGQM